MEERKYRGSEEQRKKWREQFKKHREKNRKGNNEYLREWMRDKRGGFGNIETVIANYFPKEELSNRLDKILDIEEDGLKNLICIILNENRFMRLKQEINDKLEDISKNNPYDLEKKLSRNLLYELLIEKKLLPSKQIFKIQYNTTWAKAIEEFMLEKDYVKEGDKYVKKQE
jgi:hypothetical protein